MNFAAHCDPLKVQGWSTAASSDQHPHCTSNASKKKIQLKNFHGESRAKRTTLPSTAIAHEV